VVTRAAAGQRTLKVRVVEDDFTQLLPATSTVNFYEPADSELPTETDWSTSRYLTHTPTLFEALRERVALLKCHLRQIGAECARRVKHRRREIHAGCAHRARDEGRRGADSGRRL
jgi:hypothetical protein